MTNIHIHNFGLGVNGLQREVMTPLLGISGGKILHLTRLGEILPRIKGQWATFSLKIMNTLTKEERQERLCGPSKGTQQHKGLHSSVSSHSQISIPRTVTCPGTCWTGDRAGPRAGPLSHTLSLTLPLGPRRGSRAGGIREVRWNGAGGTPRPKCL